MTTNDRDFAKKITTYLDHGTVELKAGTAYRLQLARAKALARLADPKRAAEPQLEARRRGCRDRRRRQSHPGQHPALARDPARHRRAFGVQQWQAYQQLRDIEETDAAILSSDLPIDAYLDRGFQNWLKHASDED